jgi:uridine kinase
LKVVGIAGGSGSGKTTFARELVKSFSTTNAAILSQDSYYFDQSKKFDKDGGKVNFDHPNSIDWSLMVQNINELISVGCAEIPIYDFVTHSRLKKSLLMKEVDVLIVDGILLLAVPELLPLLELKIFIDCPEEIRLERRLRRDTTERGRTKEGVLNQFYNQVKPMHDEYVGPSQKNGDLVISGLSNFSEQTQRVVKLILADS